MLQLFVTLTFYMVLVIPTGLYLYRVATHQPTFADGVMDRVDGFLYKLAGINPHIGMSWKKYAAALVGTNIIMVLLGYLILRTQGILLLNPQDIPNMNPSLAFNTVISFMTNTNLQHYSGESGLSYFSQMTVITFMMFTSAASGYAACIAFVRGITGDQSGYLGNFFADLIRISTRVLLPFSIVGALLLVSQGVPQNLDPAVTYQTIEGTTQTMAMGPVASLEIIKHLGTNGGGFFGANSSTPMENPTIFSNLIEMYSMMLLPGACVIMFGKMAQDAKNRRNHVHGQRESLSVQLFGEEGRVIFSVMGIIFLVGVTVCVLAELAGNFAVEQFGLSMDAGNMEGKETRFGIFQSSLFTVVTTSFTTGTVNNMHDTLTPLGGMVPLLHMMLNCVFGGKGVGLINMVLYVILAVFICGLMIGRTPEYLGKKIEGKEIILTSLCLIVHPLLILGFSALAVSTAAGADGVTNPGFHGLSQVLYEYASSAANNGSGFEGLADNSTFWNISTGLVMFFGRYIPIVLQLAIAGSLLKKKHTAESLSTLHTGAWSFVLVLVVTVYVFAALTFLPALTLGPIAEHVTLMA